MGSGGLTPEISSLDSTPLELSWVPEGSATRRGACPQPYLDTAYTEGGSVWIMAAVP